MAGRTDEEDPRHARFLDLCLLYGDFNRAVFLQAIVDWFVRSASPNELKSLRTAIRDRAKVLRKNGSRGRPRAEQSWEWICSTLRLVWKRDIEGRSWREIAAASGLKPTRPNLRTLQVRRDLFAQLLCKAIPGRTGNPAELNRMLGAKNVRRLLRSRLALPFDTHPEECKRIVLALAPRGLAFEAGRLPRSAK